MQLTSGANGSRPLWKPKKMKLNLWYLVCRNLRHLVYTLWIIIVLCAVRFYWFILFRLPLYGERRFSVFTDAQTVTKRRRQCNARCIQSHAGLWSSSRNATAACMKVLFLRLRSDQTYVTARRQWWKANDEEQSVVLSRAPANVPVRGGLTNDSVNSSLQCRTPLETLSVIK